MARQLSFLGPKRHEHGGEIRKGCRKIERPIDPARPLHVVMRSTRARGKWSFLHRKNESRVRSLVYTTARKHGVSVYRFANVGNHLHVLVKTPSREAFKSFLREAGGRIAMIVTGARKGKPMKGRFWDRLAYSRVVSWGRDFKNLKLYFVKNLFEAAGLLTREMKAAGVRPIPVSWLPRLPGLPEPPGTPAPSY